MNGAVEAIYENGVLRPLRPLDLAENERVTIEISQASSGPGYADTEDENDLRAIGELRRRTAVITDSMAEAIIAGRGEY